MRFITQAALCLLACASTLPGLGAATPVYATNSALSSESHYIEARAPISASQVVKWIPNAYSDTQTGWGTFVQAPLSSLPITRGRPGPTRDRCMTFPRQNIVSLHISRPCSLHACVFLARDGISPLKTLLGRWMLIR
jgi:hypothetical protein